ncbi:ribosomal maturation YjgA family protein [Coleofasciculus chthonoplastes]|uniref:ribosomal maturation YjgA family protein n=1 Tax=Coleofasciculus chthonoplastes TaxID=64178 RepID=UPI00330381FD
MKYRIILLISIILIAPLGYAVRFYAPAPEWLNDRLGSFAYEIFWILLVGLFFPQASPLWTAVGVCIVTCLLEVLQLWQSPFLQAIRATLLGRVILGNTFTWSDFPAYFIGSFLGWVWMRSALVYSRQSHRPSKS